MIRTNLHDFTTDTIIIGSSGSNRLWRFFFSWWCDSAKCVPVFTSTRNLTHWGRVTHICVGTNTNIASENGLSPGRRQAIICTNAGILLTGPLGTNFSEILIEIQTFSFKKIRLKMSSAKCCPFRLGLNESPRDITLHDKWSGFWSHMFVNNK